MKAGIPNPLPGSVSVLHLAELGMSVRFSATSLASLVALASPQSTISVTLCLPTMMLPGLMTRCSTLRSCV
jgi:hypothetical protein